RHTTLPYYLTPMPARLHIIFRLDAPPPTTHPASPQQRPWALPSQFPNQTRTRKFLCSPFWSCTSQRKRDIYDLQQACPPIRLQLEKQRDQGEKRRKKFGV